MELAGFPLHNGCFLPLIMEDHPQPPGCIRSKCSGYRLKQQSQPTLLQNETNYGRRVLPAQNSGYNRATLRPGRATEQTIPTGPRMKARYQKSDGRLTDTEANKPPGSHHGSPKGRAASAFPQPGQRKGEVLNCKWSKRAPFGLIQYSKVKKGK